MYNLIKRALVTIDENEKVKLYKSDKKEEKKEEERSSDVQGSESENSEMNDSVSPAVSLAKEKARVIIDEAEREAMHIREEAAQYEKEARKKADQIISNAQQGLLVKEQNIEKQWNNKMNSAVNAIQKASKNFQDSQTEYVELTSEKLHLIIRLMIQKALCMELEENREQILFNKTREMMKRVMSLKDIVFKFNPADFSEFPDELKMEMKDTLPSFEIRQDRAVEKGGVVVESNYGTLDGTLENQFEILDEIIRDVFGEQ